MEIGLQAYIKGSVEAVQIYKEAFGATLGLNVKNDDGTYLHAELYRDGKLLFSLSESSSGLALENMKKYSPIDYPTMNFGITFDTVEDVKHAYDILCEGGNILLPIGELPWTACGANVIDKFGIFWYLQVASE